MWLIEGYPWAYPPHGGAAIRVAREGIPEGYRLSKDLGRRGESHVDILGRASPLDKNANTKP